MNELFYSKIILFGEYSMIFDNTALMVPFRHFKAAWKMNPALDQPGKQASNKSIRKFRQYLSENEEAMEENEIRRIQPHSQEAEQTLVGAMLLDNQVIPSVVTMTR